MHYSIEAGIKMSLLVSQVSKKDLLTRLQGLLDHSYPKDRYSSRSLGQLVRWLRVIFRPDVYRVEESMKFGTTNLFGVRNKFSLGAT